jgi:hypothetical protein
LLQVGAFDGFYAFLTEHRGTERVVAVDNEQYRLWAASRGGSTRKALKASARTIACSARRSSIGGWTRSRYLRPRLVRLVGFADTGLERLAQIAGFSRVESVVVAEIDDHPRLMAQLVA